MIQLFPSKTISIIVPTRNEEHNIFPLVERIHTTLTKDGITYEIIFVDDHSEDRTEYMTQLAARTYPIKFFKKQGKRGKAFSILEGVTKARYATVAMLDADLQYPPEALPEMIQLLKTSDIVVANRKHYEDRLIRRTLNRGFRYVFGTLLFGMSHDVQSGLKVFKKEVFETIQFTPNSGWTFDLEFLHRAREAGYLIDNYDITFYKRNSGESKIGTLKASMEIGMNALRVRAKKIHPQPLYASQKQEMLHAGVGFKKRKYVTHTTLHHSFSALQTFTTGQKAFIFLSLLTIIASLIANPLVSLQIIIGALSFIYFVDTLFNFFIVSKSLHEPQEISVTDEEIAALDEESLPIYTILCPMYKESHMITHFLESIGKLSWPKKKLDVILLLEQDDRESVKKAETLNLPPYVRYLVVPDSQPKTKPKACNFGLSHAKGEYVVIYDTEDIPDPMQLKKAFISFQRVGENIACLQAKLNYFNPHQNLLTRFFTAEYSLWFDVTLPGLQAVQTNIPLGGTSNHFRTKQLLLLHGWDPFNVTEDADLGMRLFKLGYKTAVIDSVTLEEANSKVGNWFRQRSRWIKGYMQTYLVHTRKLFDFHMSHGLHAWFFHLVIGGKIAFILINPLLWLATISYFTLYKFVGPTIESLYPPLVFYMAGISLVMGNFLFMYYYMIGTYKRGHYDVIKYVFLVPIYWLMISISGMIALYQLILKPHYWEKTVHGLHITYIQKKNKKHKTKSEDKQLMFPVLPRLAPIRYLINLFI